MEIKRPDPDLTPLRFGKYKGMSPCQIARADPGYIVWLYDTINPKVCSKDLALNCEDEMDDPFDYMYSLDDDWGDR